MANQITICSRATVLTTAIRKIANSCPGWILCKCCVTFYVSVFCIVLHRRDKSRDIARALDEEYWESDSFEHCKWDFFNNFIRNPFLSTWRHYTQFPCLLKFSNILSQSLSRNRPFFSKSRYSRSEVEKSLTLLIKQLDQLSSLFLL